MNETLKNVAKDIGWGSFIVATLTIIGAYVNAQLFTASTNSRISALEQDNTTIKQTLFGSDGTAGMSAKLNRLSDQVEFIYTKAGGK